MNPVKFEEAKTEIQSMFEHVFVKFSDSAYVAAIFFVPQKDGKLLFCIDCSWLNNERVKNRYRLPLLEKLLECLGSAKVLEKINL